MILYTGYKRRIMIPAIVICSVVLVLGFAFYVYKESTEYHIVKYGFSDSRIRKDRVSFVFISDLHNRQYGDKNKCIVDDIVRINPDFVVLGGDMITSCLEKWTDYSDTLDFICNIKKSFPVYYCIGNHEERLKRRPEKFPEGEYEIFTSKLEEIGTPLLIDEKIILEEFGIILYSLNIEHDYYRKFVTRELPDTYVEEHIGKPDSNYYSILTVHNPEHFKKYAKWGADLTLSGHIHGGIVRIPLLGGVISPAMKLFPKYDGGEFTIGSSKMVLSRGLGSHTIPIRVNNKAELIVVDIEKK